MFFCFPKKKGVSISNGLGNWKWFSTFQRSWLESAYICFKRCMPVLLLFKKDPMVWWIRHCPADPCKSEFITILWIGINISIVMQCNAMQFQQLILQSCYIIKEWVYSLMTGIIIHRNMNWRWIAILRSLKCLDYIKTVDYIITDLPLLMLRTGQCAVRTGTSVSWFLVNLVQEKLKPPRRSSSS